VGAARAAGAGDRRIPVSAVFVPIDLNTASDADILTIPGLGNRMLREFKEYRPYKAIEQFRREIGKYVAKEEVARLERHVAIATP
jgi:radical SAM superfamily enzyme with C-terminal helix-hairpin-helix motif